MWWTDRRTDRRTGDAHGPLMYWSHNYSDYKALTFSRWSAICRFYGTYKLVTFSDLLCRRATRRTSKFESLINFTINKSYQSPVCNWFQVPLLAALLFTTWCTPCYYYHCSCSWTCICIFKLVIIPSRRREMTFCISVCVWFGTCTYVCWNPGT